jgi:hypothetical protein
MNGKGSRRLKSWIEEFVKYTSHIESPEIFRRWTAITTIAAVLEQKVWGWTNDYVWPNMYTFLVGHPGVGKSRTIKAARKICETLAGTSAQEFHIAPTDMTGSALIDELKAAERIIPDPAGDGMHFHSMFLMSDDWQVIMSSWKDDLIAGMTTFYDVSIPFTQSRRGFGKDKQIVIKAPQLSIMAGTTPNQLLATMPGGSWEQGFASRTVFIFSDERRIEGSIFKQPERDSNDLVHDIHIIFGQQGQLSNAEDFIEAVDNWRLAKQPPVPNHPKLLHYNSRRLMHLLKLCVVACVDRGDKPIINRGDFDRAIKWLIEAEYFMPNIFQAGAGNADAKAMEEILYFIKMKGRDVDEGEIANFASKIIPAQSVERVLGIMVLSNMIERVGTNPKYGTGTYNIAAPREP